MSIEELMELKAKYERNLVFAEAKLSVIDEIIANAQAKEHSVADEVVNISEFNTQSY